MIFFFKSDGTLIKSAPETVYQGSAEAGKVYVVAPLNANMLVDVYYELPNGERWGAYLLENNGTVINNEELPDGWALWSTTLESAITQYAGDLKAQFGFYQSSGNTDKVPLITSQGVTIKIVKGVVRDLPEKPTDNAYAEIKAAISSIKQDIANLPNEYLENTNEVKIALKNNGAVEYSENATAETIAKRDSDGKINIYDGTEDLNAVNVRQFNAALEKKVDDTSVSSAAVKDTIAQRTTTGQLKAADGVADDDLATVKQLNAVQGNYTDITNIDLNTGDTTVEYDTELGITVNAKGTLTHKNGATEQPKTKFELPIIAGAGVSIDKKETEEKVEIKSLNSNLENGTDEVLIQTTDTNQSFKVMKDGRAKVQAAPKESTDIVRLEDIKNMSATIVDLGRSNSMTSDDYTKLENNENALLIYDGVIYRRSRGTNYGYDEMQFESIDDSVQTATIYITNCVVTAADEAAGVISVTDTAGLKVGMTIMFTTSGGSVLLGISYRKIASIDTENKKIAMDGIVIDSDTLTAGSFIAIKANATSINLTNCVVTTADEAAGVISVTDGKSLTIGMYIDFRTSGGSRLAGISNRKIIAKDTANNKITVSGTVIDSDTLTTGCYITLANDIGFNKIYNRVLRIGKQKPDSTTAYVRYAYIPIGGLPVTPSTATASATSGTFTDSEWSKLQANDNNYILFNNEIYRLADKAHSGTTGIWSYTHTGWDGTAIMDKSINVTVSTGAWTLVVGQGGSSVQADYNQNDSTAADYIKNRPFYEARSLTEVANFKVISGNLKEAGSTVTVEYDGERATGVVTDRGEGSSSYDLTITTTNFIAAFGLQKSDQTVQLNLGHKNNYNINVGDRVVFNGVEYEVKSVPSGDFVGKSYIADGEIDFENFETSSATFLFVFMNELRNGFYLDMFTAFTTASINFNLKTIQETIKTIDPKFLPSAKLYLHNIVLSYNKNNIVGNCFICIFSSSMNEFDFINFTKIQLRYYSAVNAYQSAPGICIISTNENNQSVDIYGTSLSTTVAIVEAGNVASLTDTVTEI